MNSRTTSDAPPPEAVLIRRARDAMGISPEAAAPRTGVIKASQWRNIESGKSYAKDAVLARMAHVVAVTPEELEGVDRAEAAEILRRIQRHAGGDEPADEDANESDAELVELAQEFIAQGQELIARGERLLAHGRRSGSEQKTG